MTVMQRVKLIVALWIAFILAVVAVASSQTPPDQTLPDEWGLEYIEQYKPEPEPRTPLHTASIVSMYVAGGSAFYDNSSTAWALGSGCCREQNRLMRWATDNPWKWATMKGGGDATFIYLMNRLRKQGRYKSVIAMCTSYAALNIYAGWHNWGEYNDWKRAQVGGGR
jgi:hypothetical protein